MKNPSLCIDARMINSSSIGRYIRGIICNLINYFKIIAIGNAKEINEYPWSKYVDIIHTDLPIYSFKEQIKMPFKIPKCDIFWSPHYNIPILPIRPKIRVVTIHDVYHLAFSKYYSFFQRKYAKFMIKSAVKLSNVVLTDSEFTRAEIIKYINTSKTHKCNLSWCG